MPELEQRGVVVASHEHAMRLRSDVREDAPRVRSKVEKRDRLV